MRPRTAFALWPFFVAVLAFPYMFDMACFWAFVWSLRRRSPGRY